jgi:hypothetical protein
MKGKPRSDYVFRPRVCVQCGRTFTPHASRQVICSPECRHKRKKIQDRKCELRTRKGQRVRTDRPKTGEGVCAICGKTFDLHGHYKVCCSPECARINQQNHIAARRRRKPRRVKTAADRINDANSLAPCVRTVSGQRGNRAFMRGRCPGGTTSNVPDYFRVYS